MTEGEVRPLIPADLERRVLLEAGHRCAIPTCKAETTEIAHIIPYREVKEHMFDNLIALCPNCHTRFDNRQIDRKSMLIYKSNLALLNSRYGTYERRILEDFAEHPESNTVTLNSGIVILANYLIKDGVLEQTGGRMIGSSPDTEWLLEFSLTPKGRTIIESFALDIL
jgi:hypothetical protein